MKTPTPKHKLTFKTKVLLKVKTTEKKLFDSTFPADICKHQVSAKSQKLIDQVDWYV